MAAPRSGCRTGQPGGGRYGSKQTWPGQSFGSDLLRDKVAVVTGAARGIGRAIALDMAANGAHIVGIYLCRNVLPKQDYVPAKPEDLVGPVHAAKFYPPVCLFLALIRKLESQKGG